MFVKPAEGRKVRHPITKQHLDAEGAEVPESTYWLRRLAEGDVVRRRRAWLRLPLSSRRPKLRRSSARGTEFQINNSAKRGLNT
jgi:hypothetical protein